jgi:AhpC/TSA family
MSQPDRPSQFDRPIDRRYGRWIGVLALVILALITLNTVLTKPIGAAGLAPGTQLPPFAVPLATGDLQGAANVATHANDGPAKRPACSVRGPRILNVCELYEAGPLVLALFVDEGSCPRILVEMQALAPEFPGVRFAAVSIKGHRGELRALVREHGLSFPVGIDEEGTLATLYKVASCPQVTFAYPGGVAQGKAFLLAPPLATLRARVRELVAGAHARDWSRPS